MRQIRLVSTSVGAKIASSSNLKAPEWNIKAIIENSGLYQSSVDAREYSLYGNKSLDDLVSIHGELQIARQQRQEAATLRNKLLKSVKGNVTVKDQLQGDLLAQSKELKDRFKVADTKAQSLENEFNLIVDSVPNLIEPDTATISGEFREVEQINTANLHPANKARAHTEIGRALGLLDIESGSRVSGTGSYYLQNGGALLEQALVQFALTKCRKFGFSLVSPPSLVRQEFVTACGFRPRDNNDEVQVYSVNGGGGPGSPALSLAGTAEIPLAGQQSHKVLDLSQNPLKHAGVSKSYRAEAGARGADTKGLYRVHEFTKVEMFMWTRPDLEVSSAALQDLLAYQKEIVEDLELPVRVIKIGPTDLGAPAYEKYDIEAWMPGRGSWGEISSVSNCLDYQSRRLHTKTHDGDFVHTLNGTALAVPRIIIAIMENNYDPETGKIRLPKALQGFFGSEYLE